MERDDLLDRWPEAERLLEPFLDLPPELRRERALEACGDDGPLRSLIGRLLVEPDTEPGLSPLSLELLAQGPEPPTPPRIGPYRVLADLGRGGMSRVYRAVRDGAPAPEVAIKLLDRWPSADALRRFEREGQTLARLEHAHIARLYDAGATGEGTPYLVMELVRGVPIDRYCSERGLDLAARLRLFRQVCAAVECAHAHLVVHRDLKPANVLVNEDGDVKLLDFGIAKWLDDLAAEPPLTLTSHRVLTPANAAPEQFRGEPVTATTDVYQLGLLLYVLLTGHPAYAPEEGTAAALQQAVLDTDPRRPSEVVPERSAGLAGDLDAVVLKALRREPRERYASVEALRRDVDAYLEHRPVTARRGTLAYACRKYVQRHRAAAAAGATAVAALAAGVIAVLAESRAAAVERDRARSAEARATAINTYLVQDMLAAATPAGSRGRALSVTEVLANASRSVGYAFAGQPATEAEVRATLATSYLALGQLAEARDHAEAAVKLLEPLAARDPAPALRARALLARVAMEEGRYHEAVKEATAALVAQLRVLGEGARDSLATRALLARLLRRQGELVRAEQMAREALATANAALPGDWRLGAELRTQLAGVLVDEGNGIGAEALVQEALALQERWLGPTHPDVLATLALRADVLNALLRFDDALALRKQLVAASEGVYGPRHPRTAQARNGLAMAFDRLGRDAEVAEQTALALSIYTQALGSEHADTLAVLRNHGITVRRAEGPDRAEPIYRQVLDSRRRVLGPRHVDTIQAAVGLANLLAETPRENEARAAALDVIDTCSGLADGPDADVRSLDLCAKFLLEVHPRDLRDPARARALAERAVAAEGRGQYLRLLTLARAQRALGDWPGARTTLREALALPQAIQSWTTEEEFVELLTEHGSPAELESWLRERVEAFRRLRGPEDRLRAKTERHLARLYAREGRHAEAEALYVALLELLRRSLPETDFEVGRAMSELGELMVARGAFDEAEPLLIGGFESMVGDRRAGPIGRAEARARVVRLYEAWRRPGEAQRWRERPLQKNPGWL